MGYCTYSDIQADFKSITFTTTSLVTQAAVTQFITEASAYIDSCIGSRYVTPVVSATGLALASMLCRTLVSERVRGILATNQKTNTDANQDVKGAGFNTADVMNTLQEIMDGILPLNGETLLLSNAGFISNNQQNNVQPRFNKNRRQW